MLQCPIPYDMDIEFQAEDKTMEAPMPRENSNPTSPTSKKSAIDYSKFKTKMCRHFMMGLQCPFEDRCAFAHGDEQLQERQARQQQQMQQQQQQQEMPPPPSYNSTIAMPSSGNFSDSYDFSPVASPMESRPPSPPAYPSRFRYDPYSNAGVVYSH